MGARDIDLLYTCLLQMRRIQQAAKIVTCPEAHMVLPQLSPDQRHRHITINILVDDGRSAPERRRRTDPEPMEEARIIRVKA